MFVLQRVITELNCTGSEVAVSDCPGFTVDNVDAENYKPSGVVCASMLAWLTSVTVI